MSISDYSRDWDAAFAWQRQRALRYIELYNMALPRKHCPRCQTEGHLPGIPCPDCGYRHAQGWCILRDTEMGYDAVCIGKPMVVIASFNVDDD